MHYYDYFMIIVIYIHFISVLSLSSSTPGSFFELVRRTGGLQRSLGGHQSCASKCSNLAPKIKNTQPKKLTLDMENAWKNDEKCAKSVDQGKTMGFRFSPRRWNHDGQWFGSTLRMRRWSMATFRCGRPPSTSHPPFSPEKTQNDTMV